MIWKHDGKCWYLSGAPGLVRVCADGAKYRLEVYFPGQKKPGIVHVYSSLAYAKARGEEIAGADENPLLKTSWILGLIGAGAVLGVGLWAATRTGSDTTPTLSAALSAVKALSSTALCQTNDTVKAFQAAWNAAGNSPLLTVSGDYDTDTAGAAQSYDGSAPGACTFPTASTGSQS